MRGTVRSERCLWLLARKTQRRRMYISTVRLWVEAIRGYWHWTAPLTVCEEMKSWVDADDPSSDTVVSGN